MHEVVYCGKSADDGATSILIGNMSKHHTNTKLVLACLRSLQYIGEVGALVERMVRKQALVRVMHPLCTPYYPYYVHVVRVMHPLLSLLRTRGSGDAPVLK